MSISALLAASSIAAPPPESETKGAEDRAQELPRYRIFERQPGVLLLDEVEEIRRHVLGRNSLMQDMEPATAPWYFHYDLGLELERAGDPQRALDAFLEAANRRPDPRRQIRTYGMWFKDYLPYFFIARAHVELQNWECAASALEVSRGLGEISVHDREFDELVELVEKLDSRGGS